jgi:hypothetical protein
VSRHDVLKIEPHSYPFILLSSFMYFLISCFPVKKLRHSIATACLPVAPVASLRETSVKRCAFV